MRRFQISLLNSFSGGWSPSLVNTSPQAGDHVNLAAECAQAGKKIVRSWRDERSLSGFGVLSPHDPPVSSIQPPEEAVGRVGQCGGREHSLEVVRVLKEIFAVPVSLCLHQQPEAGQIPGSGHESDDIGPGHHDFTGTCPPATVLHTDPGGQPLRGVRVHVHAGDLLQNRNGTAVGRSVVHVKFTGRAHVRQIFIQAAGHGQEITDFDLRLLLRPRPGPSLAEVFRGWLLDIEKALSFSHTRQKGDHALLDRGHIFNDMAALILSRSQSDVVDDGRGRFHLPRGHFHLPVAFGQNAPLEQDDDTTGALLPCVLEHSLESLQIPAGRGGVNPLPLSGVRRKIQLGGGLRRGRLFNLRSTTTTSQQKYSC